MQIVAKLSLSIFLVALTVSNANLQTPKTNVSNQGPQTYQKQLLDLINKVRSTGCSCGKVRMKKGLPMSWNIKLEKAAALHAKDIHSRQILSHRGKYGSNTEQRIEKTGYRWKSFAENIAEGFDSPQSVFEAWMQSPGHCKNIMGDYSELGAAKVADYWVVDFGRPQ